MEGVRAAGGVSGPSTPEADAAGRPVPEGETGASVLLTHLANHVQPLIRYPLGDRVRWHHDACGCGSLLPVIEVEGRSDDTLTVQGRGGRPVRLLPLALGTVLEEEAGLADFQLLQQGPARLRLSTPACGPQAVSALAQRYPGQRAEVVNLAFDGYGYARKTLRAGFTTVRDLGAGEADALVSAGATGALLAASLFHVKDYVPAGMDGGVRAVARELDRAGAKGTDGEFVLAVAAKHDDRGGIAAHGELPEHLKPIDLGHDEEHGHVPHHLGGGGHLDHVARFGQPPQHACLTSHCWQ